MRHSLALCALLLAAVLTPAAPAQTVERLVDINPGSAGSNPRDFAVLDGVLYFSADDGTSGVELWRSDGTAGGTERVADINPSGSSSPSGFTDFDGALYFLANDGTSGAEPWRSDGTAAGTERVADIFPGFGGSGPQYFTVFDGALYFRANDGTGYELWRTNGTAAGTERVADINPSGGSIASDFTVLDGILYFVADDGTSGQELWRSDGTAGGTERVADINPGSGSSFLSNLTVFDGALYFQADDGASGYELWRSDGTAAGTARLVDINPGSAGSNPRDFAVLDGVLFFTAFDSSSGEELWRTDGTAAGTGRVTDINPGGGSSRVVETTVFDGALYFRANDGTSGAEPWRSDGTAAGTERVADINPGSGSSVPELGLSQGFSEFDGSLYFLASDGTSGFELWRSDGTAAGTERVADINPGSGNSVPVNLAVFDGALYFTADDGSSGRELWVARPEGCSDALILSDFAAFADGNSVELRNTGALPVNLAACSFVATYNDVYVTLDLGDDTVAPGATVVVDPGAQVRNVFGGLALLDRADAPALGTAITDLQADLIASLVYLGNDVVFGFYHRNADAFAAQCDAYIGGMRLGPFAVSQCSLISRGDGSGDGSSDGPVALTHAELTEAMLTAERGATAIDGAALPTAFGLSAAYPNPMQERGTVTVDVPAASDVRVVVYDVLGRSVATLLNEAVEAGRYTVTLDASALAPGTYLVRMTAGGYAATQRVTVVR